MASARLDTWPRLSHDALFVTPAPAACTHHKAPGKCNPLTARIIYAPASQPSAHWRSGLLTSRQASANPTAIPLFLRPDCWAGGDDYGALTPPTAPLPCQLKHPIRTTRADFVTLKNRPSGEKIQSSSVAATIPPPGSPGGISARALVTERPDWPRPARCAPMP